MRTALERVRALFKAGFFDIFGATVLNSVISFIYGIFIIRLLSTTEYGTFSYIQNILNFGFMFCTLGGGVGLLQFCAEKIDVKKKYGFCKLALKMGVIGSVFIPVIMIAYTRIDKSGINNLTAYIAECSLLLFFYFIKDWATANLRWQFKNREYGIVMNVHSVLNACLAVLGAYLGGVHGVIIGIYFAYVGSGLCALFFLRKSTLPNLYHAQKIDVETCKAFAKYSITMCIVNALISVLFTIDLFVIGNIVRDADQIAMYKAASTIPFALNMIPNSIMIFMYPYIARHKSEPKWLQKNIRVLYLANAAINGIIGIILILAAPIIINILFGSKYSGILPVFRVLTLSYIVSACLRTPSANLLGALKMSKTALIVSAFTVIVSITLGLILVSRYGILGAAAGSVLTFGIVGVISFLIIIFTVYTKK